MNFNTYEEALHAMEDGEIITYNSSALMPYQVHTMPKVGDYVSTAFNGDYYPEGTITKISPTGAKITTSNGKVFQRSRKVDHDPDGRKFNRAQWMETDSPFYMIHGYHDEKNPSF